MAEQVHALAQHRADVRLQADRQAAVARQASARDARRLAQASVDQEWERRRRIQDRESVQQLDYAGPDLVVE
jgi:hypothetical protein